MSLMFRWNIQNPKICNPDLLRLVSAALQSAQIEVRPLMLFWIMLKPSKILSILTHLLSTKSYK